MCALDILCDLSKVPFEISQKILDTYTAKHAFYEVLNLWRIMISQRYGILSPKSDGPQGFVLQREIHIEIVM